MVNTSGLLVTWLVATSCLYAPVQGARILALMVTPSPSHHIWNRSLMLALVARGHQVTVLSPNAEKTQPGANFTDLVIEGAYDYLSDPGEFNFEEMSDYSVMSQVHIVFKWGEAMCRHGIRSPAAQRLIASDEKYDLIITEVVLEECFLGFLHKFHYPPIMAITAWSSPNWANTILGNPDNPSYIPEIIQPYTDHMSFMERAGNLMTNLYTQLYRRWKHLPIMDELVRENFGAGVPSVSELEDHIDVILVNQHFSMDYPRPMLPSMVPVAGMHIRQCQPMPSDVQKWLDEAENGAIFFSLGSNLRSDKLGSTVLTALLSAFRELPQRILWKFESDSLPGQPANVKIGKWLPQNDILCHPNVRLFITHAGLLSTQEAVYHGVPIVGVPFMGDQHVNVVKAMHQGAGEKLEFANITKESILEVVRKVITKPSYRTNMQRLSSQFRDQPQTAMERAIFWVEYVIRHRGTSHMRSAALDLAWYQYLLLDVIATILLAALVALALMRLALRVTWRLFCGKKKQNKKKTN